jgi:peptidoglycan/xylan/chitin deacetylase (PgdA/CDA1 family)
MDHDLYPWSNIADRGDFRWKGGARIGVALMVSVEWFPIVPGEAPFRAPGHMQTAYPDYRHYTSRDYGNRVGVWRFLEAFAQVGATASFAVNATVAARYPELIAAIVAGGHEVVAHGRDMDDTIASPADEARERAVIRGSLDVLEQATGMRPKGWMSIARSQSFATPRLLAEAGLSHMCDWVHDELPVKFATEAGAIVNVPYNHELSDRQIITVQQQSAESFAEQIRDAWTWLDGEGAARLLPVHLTPYIMGLPYRIAALEGLLAWLAARDGTTFLSADEAAGTYKA